MRLRVLDSLHTLTLLKVDLLETQQIAAHKAYTNLLKISDQKFETQKEITADFVRLADSWKSEADYYQKKYRKQRRQKGLLTAGVVVLIGLIIVK